MATDRSYSTTPTDPNRAAFWWLQAGAFVLGVAGSTSLGMSAIIWIIGLGADEADTHGAGPIPWTEPVLWAYRWVPYGVAILFLIGSLTLAHASIRAALARARPAQKIGAWSSVVATLSASVCTLASLVYLHFVLVGDASMWPQGDAYDSMSTGQRLLTATAYVAQGWVILLPIAWAACLFGVASALRVASETHAASRCGTLAVAAPLFAVLSYAVLWITPAIAYWTTVTFSFVSAAAVLCLTWWTLHEIRGARQRLEGALIRESIAPGTT